MDSEQVKQSEASLLGAVLRGGSKTFEQVRELVSVSDFGVHAFSFAWQAMERLYIDGMSIDTITVGDQLERDGKMTDFVSGMWSGRALLSDLRGSGDPRNVASYAENVRDYSVKRWIKDEFLPKYGMQSANGRRAGDIIQDALTELTNITLAGSEDEFTVPLKVAVSEAYDETDLASKGKAVGVKSGLLDLDKMIGSFKKSNVYIIAGRPGQGKTGLLLTIASNAVAQKKRVAIFSLEMSRVQVAQRLIAQYANLDLFRVIEGKLRDTEWAVYTDAVDNVASFPIVINDLTSINIANIRNTARNIKRNGGLDLVIVDYIQLADAGKKVQNRELEVSEVSRGLKKLARELEVPVLAASQLSRDIEKRSEKKPVLSDLRESGSLEQDAYSVMFIYRPDEAVKTGAEIIIAKHRNGPVGTVPLYFRENCARFENATTRTENFGNHETYN